MPDACNEQHALVGQFAFHLERVMLTMSDGTEEEGAMLELCPIATKILMDHGEQFGDGLE